MKLALIGYGKMGRLVEELALRKGHTVVFKTDLEGNDAGQALTKANLNGAEVAIDFTVPDAVVNTVERVAAAGVDMVVGTTGWLAHLDQVRRIINERSVGLVYGSNFSIGVNLFFRLIEEAATVFCQHAQYDPWIYEMHHRAKLDAPSGTALKLKEILTKAYGQRPISVASNRAGWVPGEHTVGFDSEADTLTFTHTARSRQAFAAGALLAAEWIHGRKGVHEFPEVLSCQ